MSKETELREALEVAENELYNYLKRPELPNIPKGTPLLVWSQYETKDNARIKYFSHWDDAGRCCCRMNYITQKSSPNNDTTYWRNWDYAPGHGNIYAWVPNDETVPEDNIVMIKLRNGQELAVVPFDFDDSFWRVKGRPDDILFIAKL